MIQFVKKLTIKQRILSALAFLSLFLFLFLFFFSFRLQSSQQNQQIAKRWNSEEKSAQISCFFPEGMVTGDTQFLSVKKKAEQALGELSISPKREGAKLLTDAYSAMGEITLSHKRNTLTAKAVGISGDFFLFHPLFLVNGSYFSEENPAKDSILLDEEAAWQLFGSNDIAGMQVMIGNIPHTISGVIKRETGRLNQAAGLDKTVVYVSYQTLKSYGVTKGINTYEIVMPNPIQGFAYSQVKENLGFTETELENKITVIENSKRFSLFSLLKIIKDYGTRSMNTKDIIYPYWENAARGAEDILSLFLLLEILLLLTAAVSLFFLLFPFIRSLKKKLPSLWLFCRSGIKKAFTKKQRPKRKRFQSKKQLY